MKFTASFVPLVFASLAASTSLFSSSQTILSDDDLKVPGENPLKFCQNSDSYTLTINRVDLTPNPPLPSVPSYALIGGANCDLSGKTLSITAQGNFTAKVCEGASINISVKYGLITLIRQTANLCEQIKNVGMECPLDGIMSLSKDVDLPGIIPSVGDVYYLVPFPRVC